MALSDARQVEPGATLQADVCVVGAGPAGLAVAMELADAGRRVLLLESGGLSVEPETAALSEVENAAAPLCAEGPPRDRRFGGTAWYGRCVALDPIDFEPRSWVPWSGWPVSRLEVESRYPRAARFLGLARPGALTADFWKDEPACRVLSGGGIEARVHLFTRTKDLGRRHRRTVAASSPLTALLHATVVGIDVDEGSRVVTRLRVRGPGGHEFSSRAPHYILACGGLENTRLLLMLLADQPGVLGLSGDLVGRCYMNHARCDGVARLRLNSTHPQYLALYRRLIESGCRKSQCRVQLAAGLDEDTQRREALLNASAFFYPSSLPRLAELGRHLDQLRRSAAARRFGRVDAVSAGRLTRESPLLAQASLARLRRRPFGLDRLIMVEQIEQAPERESRVVLGEGRDRFGRPCLQLQWRIGGDTLRTQRRFHQLLAERFRQQGVGTFESALADPDFEPSFGDAGHPMGSTRMSTDPRQGVVDRHSRVHALDNLHIAGSSVFPTGGHANPTLALVALAMRLGEHLR